MCVRNLRPWGLYAACCIGWGLAVVLYDVMPGAKKLKTPIVKPSEGADCEIYVGYAHTSLHNVPVQLVHSHKFATVYNGMHV